MKIDFFDFSALNDSGINGVSLTADNIVDMSELNPEPGSVLTAEEAADLFYKYNDCLSDDYDKELARMEKWHNDMGNVITD